MRKDLLAEDLCKEVLGYLGFGILYSLNFKNIVIHMKDLLFWFNDKKALDSY